MADNMITMIKGGERSWFTVAGSMIMTRTRTGVPAYLERARGNEMWTKEIRQSAIQGGKGRSMSTLEGTYRGCG